MSSDNEEWKWLIKEGEGNYDNDQWPMIILYEGREMMAKANLSILYVTWLWPEMRGNYWYQIWFWYDIV